MERNTVVTVVLLLVVFIVGFWLGRVTATANVGVEQMTGIEDLGNVLNPSDSNANSASEQDAPGTTVNTNNLTDSQRQMLQALGIDADSVTITPEMVACAEAKLGAARIEEIKNGATPSFSEGASLVACYR